MRVSVCLLLACSTLGLSASYRPQIQDAKEKEIKADLAMGKYYDKYLSLTKQASRLLKKGLRRPGTGPKQGSKANTECSVRRIRTFSAAC